MLLPWSVDVPIRQTPAANWAVIALTWLVSGAAFLSGNSAAFGAIFDLHRSPAFLPQQLLLSVLPAPGLFTLVASTFFLTVFGNAVNAKLGHARYLTLYAALAIVQSLAWLAVGAGDSFRGPAGAVAGIAGAFVALYPRNDITVLYALGLFRVGSFPLASVWIIALFIAVDTFLLAAGAEALANSAAHLACLLAGAGAVVALNALGLVRSEWGEHTLYDLARGRPPGGNPDRKPRHPHATKAVRPLKSYRPFRDQAPAPAADSGHAPPADPDADEDLQAPAAPKPRAVKKTLLSMLEEELRQSAQPPPPPDPPAP